MSAAADTLERIRDALLAVIEAQTTLWTEQGCPPTFAVDGESYDWNGWLQSKLDALKQLDEAIARKRPFHRISRVRG